MSNFSKLMQQAASGIGGGGSEYRADSNDAETALWVMKAPWFFNGSGIENTMITAASADSIFVSNHDNAYDLSIYNVSSDGTLSSSKLHFEGMSNGTGAVVDPYDTDYIYMSGQYVDGTPRQIQLAKMDSSLSNTTPVWNKQTNFSVNVKTGPSPIVTENYIWQPVRMDSGVSEPYNFQDIYVTKLDKDGTVVATYQVDMNKSATTQANNESIIKVSLDETRLFLIVKLSNQQVHVACFNTSTTNLEWQIYLNSTSYTHRTMEIDNSDNSLVIGYSDSTYVYLEKLAASNGASEWRTRFSPGSGNNTMQIPIVGIKPDGSLGVLKMKDTRTDDNQGYVVTFDPSNGSIDTPYTKLAGAYNLIYPDSALPLLIGDRVYATGYIYNTNGGTSFESFLVKLDTAFTDGAAISSFFQNNFVITSRTSGDFTTSSVSSDVTTTSGAFMTAITSSLFFETTGPSNITASTETPTFNQWRS